MHVHSVGLTTDLALIATRGKVVDRGGYLVASVPEDPAYDHGNLLVLPAAPAAGELAAWIARFHHELPDPAIRHVNLAWGGVTDARGADDELAAAGFVIDDTWVMTASRPSARPAPAGVQLRPLAPDELMRAAELDFAISGGGDEGYRQFLHRRAAWQRDLVMRRTAEFWGAFDAHTLVASLGLVRLGRIARYQDVQTAPSHRKRGLASALLVAAADAALAGGQVEELVIKTLVDSDAVRVYQRAGFRSIERTMLASRAPAA